MSCLNCLPERYSGSFQGFWKHIKKDIGFSSCAAPPLYHMSSYLQKCTQAESTGRGSRNGRSCYEAPVLLLDEVAGWV